ncbi:MAG: YesL family protein [Oscillospiraceae bacterium]
MKNLFRWDNPLIQLLTALADVILTNLLCLICCLPVVTAGASIAATYKVMLNLSQDTGGGIWNTFFTAFRENFKQATAVWLITLLVGASLVCDYILIQLYFQGGLHTALLIVVAVLTFLALAILAYLYPLMIRYQNTLREHLHNAMILCIYKFPKTILMVVLHALPFALALLLPTAFLYTILFWVLMGFALIPLADVIILKPVFEELENTAK